MRRVVFIIVVLLYTAGSCAAKTIYVDVDGPNDPGVGSWKDPFRRIQDAIEDFNTESGDIVEIQPGVYTGEGNYNIDPNGKSISIRSTNPDDPNTAVNTIIDANGAGRGFYIHKFEDANCIITGLTVRNGATSGSGGGIYCLNSSPTIKNCVIIKNYAEWGGGGIYCLNSESTIQNCIIAGNLASGTGGGIRCVSCSNFAIINCTVSGNSAVQQEGEGVYCFNSPVSIKNCIVWGNGSEQIRATGGEPVVSYSDIQNDWPGGTENIDADPCFAVFDVNGDPNLWDFHLHSVYGRWDARFYRIDFNKDGIINLVDFASLANKWFEKSDNLAEDINYNGIVDMADLQIFSEYFLTTAGAVKWVLDTSTSPCIDAGDPNSIWSNELWPNGKRINMGAYGGTIEASMNGNEADFNVDGVVNFVDFAELSSRWRVEGNRIEDLTNDSVVNFADLGKLAVHWLWQQE